jgi:hypothetical protein
MPNSVNATVVEAYIWHSQPSTHSAASFVAVSQNHNGISKTCGSKSEWQASSSR